MNDPKFKIGDEVVFTNDYGVVFYGKKIKSLDPQQDGSFRYFYEPTDAPWFSVRESNLRNKND